MAVAPAWVAAETFLCKKMRVQLKEPWELNVMRTSGKRLAEVVALLKESVKPGTSTAELDELAESTIRKLGGIPSFLGYAPGGVPYPATICASPNDAVVHGIPNDVPLQAGDIISIRSPGGGGWGHTAD